MLAAISGSIGNYDVHRTNELFYDKVASNRILSINKAADKVIDIG